MERYTSGDIYLELHNVVIRNFKSIRSAEIDLRPGLNVLVGPNAGGKTNILEAISFLKKTLATYRRTIPYIPHRGYWSPEELFYNKDPENNIELGLRFTAVTPLGDGDTCVYFDIEYLVTYSLVANTIMPTKYSVTINDTRITVTPTMIRIDIDSELYEDAVRKIEKEPELKAFYKKEYSRSGDKYYLQKTINAAPPLFLSHTFISSISPRTEEDEYVYVSIARDIRGSSDTIYS